MPISLMSSVVVWRKSKSGSHFVSAGWEKEKGNHTGEYIFLFTCCKRNGSVFGNNVSYTSDTVATLYPLRYLVNYQTNLDINNIIITRWYSTSLLVTRAGSLDLREIVSRLSGEHIWFLDGEEDLRPALQAPADRGLGRGEDMRAVPLLRRRLQHHLHLHHRWGTGTGGVSTLPGPQLLSKLWVY